MHWVERAPAMRRETRAEWGLLRRRIFQASKGLGPANQAGCYSLVRRIRH